MLSQLNIVCEGIKILVLLDLSSNGTLVYKFYFKNDLKLIFSPSSTNNTEAYSPFKLTAMNDTQLPISMYVELDIDFSGPKP